MKVRLHAILLILCFLCSLSFALNVEASSKVHEYIHKYYDSHHEGEEVSSLLLLEEQADVDGAVANVPFKERGDVVFNLLYKSATSSQIAIVSELDALGIKYKQYWLVNMIVIQANYSVILSVSLHDSIRAVHPNFNFRVPLEEPEYIEDSEVEEEIEAPYAIEWNIQRVKAPEVWDLGYEGKGLVVAIADTGIQWDHPALKPQYRGFVSDSNVTHAYNWWDAVHATGSSCGKDSKFPCDDYGHGTHCTGTAVGSDHGSNQIGVAPAARWIGCRNMNAGVGSPAQYIECLQFFVAPTDLEGKNPNPSLRPHVIGNSYGCDPSENCVADSLQVAVNNVIAAGIFMSVSAGNSGSSCSTVDTPPALYANVFSVGALAFNSSTIASYSSRGPVAVNGTQLIKPDITAPGSSIRSSVPTNRYASNSGTSMASPHITGIVALLWDAKPELERNIEATRKIIEASAKHVANTVCGGNTAQNNVYGYGEVDVLAAVKHK